MSYANGTPFLNLAQTIGTDHRDWFDENEAKLDLDTKMKTLWDGAADTATILSTLQENVGELQTDVTTLEGVVSGHTSTITTINESLVLINTALNALNTQVTNKFDSAGIADPYDSSYGIYAVGDIVTYNGQRYVCSTAVTAAEPFDVSKWTAEDVQSAIENAETYSKLVATGSGATFSAQLQSLASAFSALSDQEKKHACLVISGGDYDGCILRNNSINGIFVTCKYLISSGQYVMLHLICDLGGNAVNMSGVTPYAYGTVTDVTASLYLI